MPKKDLGPKNWDRRRSAKRRKSSDRFAKRLRDRDRGEVLSRAALSLARDLYAAGQLSVDDVEKLRRLVRKATRPATDQKARSELVRFMVYLATRDDRPSPGASPMPAPVFPRGNPPTLSGAAEAPLD